MSPVLFGSCDEVDEADRYIEVEQIVPKRTVLLEEFTGQWCMNCPSAHAIVNSLKEQYGESFISVSIHAGGFGIAEGSLPGHTVFTSFKSHVPGCGSLQQPVRPVPDSAARSQPPP